MSSIVIFDPNDLLVPGRVTFYDTSLNTPDYDGESNKLVNPHMGPVSGLDQSCWVVDGDPLTLRAMTDAEKDVACIDAVKTVACDAIDANTVALIAAGFTHSGKQFSLSLSAQTNWMGVLTMSAAAGLTYPYPVATIPNGYHNAADEAEMLTIAGVALVRKGWAIASGAVLKQAVNDATTIAAVNAVTDTR